MKKYNIQNYIRYKEDIKSSMPDNKSYEQYTRDELIIKFLPLVENLARKFATTQQASGVLSINDLLQEGGDIKIPEHKLNEIRKNPKDDKMVALFFNSMFSSYDITPADEDNFAYQLPDKSEPYNINILNAYLLSLMQEHLTVKQYNVVRLFYGLDCEKHSAKEIADHIGLKVPTATVIVSQIKKEAIDHLIANVDSNQVIDYL